MIVRRGELPPWIVPDGMWRRIEPLLPKPVVREPRDGARWLMDPGRGATVVPLHAAVGGVTVADVRWEVDGARVEGAGWEISRLNGAH